jgi:HEPN domain-containing protein
MSDLEHARSLLRMAEADFNALRGMMNPAIPSPEIFFSDEIFGFHAQQAAEKCLKSWLAGLGKRYPRTHDLMIMIEELFEAGEDVTRLESLVDLNPFAVEYRYQSMGSGDDELDRDAVFHEIEGLLSRVRAVVDPNG